MAKSAAALMMIIERESGFKGIPSKGSSAVSRLRQTNMSAATEVVTGTARSFFDADQRCFPDHEFRIVDDSGRELVDRQDGRLEFRGPSAVSGYFRNEMKARELFHEG
jgi:acyl-CoA synthetase (AMP-forming)/AMP-acid ligase II